MTIAFHPSLPEGEPTASGRPTSRLPPDERSAYRRFMVLGTRWMDNDAYGHLNNVVHYSLFDTAVNRHLIEAGALDIERSEVIGLVVESGCSYYTPLAFPGDVDVGLRVARIGGASVRFEIGLFAAGASSSAARGHFVHVYVDRASRRPVPSLPASLTRALQGLI